MPENIWNIGALFWRVRLRLLSLSLDSLDNFKRVTDEDNLAHSKIGFQV